MADMILLGLAIICTAYFMVIVFYAGMGTSFAFIWLFFAALCAVSYTHLTLPTTSRV